MFVNWDQRGAGKSYPAGEPEKMSIDRFVEDTRELTEYLEKRFHQKKIYVLGHSWGTLLGVLTVTRYPETDDAYGGIGQYVEGEVNERLAYSYTMAKARETGESAALEELGGISGDPHPFDKALLWFDELQTNRRWLTRFGALCYNPAQYHGLAGEQPGGAGIHDRRYHQLRSRRKQSNKRLGGPTSSPTTWQRKPPVQDAGGDSSSSAAMTTSPHRPLPRSISLT